MISFKSQEENSKFQYYKIQNNPQFPNPKERDIIFSYFGILDFDFFK